jgi:hypothetical protein
LGIARWCHTQSDRSSDRPSYIKYNNNNDNSNNPYNAWMIEVG